MRAHVYVMEALLPCHGQAHVREGRPRDPKARSVGRDEVRQQQQVSGVSAAHSAASSLAGSPRGGRQGGEREVRGADSGDFRGSRSVMTCRRVTPTISAYMMSGTWQALIAAVTAFRISRSIGRQFQPPSR